jgi:DNA invertase Pin-like site-specific DNA recombinase
MKVVIYARYSSNRQTEQSIEGQLRACREFANANDMLVIDEYIDRAMTGRNDDRPAFQKMLADSVKRQFEAVIVYQFDRFARSRYDSAANKARLKKNGVRVISAKENVSNDPSGAFLEGVLESMAEYYSLELAQKIKRGMHESALKCQSTGGAPLGYKVDTDRHFIVDEKTAPIVIEISQRYNEGETITQICAALNKQGMKTSRGVAFNKNSLRTILKNRKYIGEYRCGDVVVPNGVPVILDKSLFESVALRMQKNKKAPAKAKANINYLLTSKLFCGECGANMVGESGTGHNERKYYYYTCTKRKRERACKKEPVQKDWIERLVVQYTIDHVLKDDVIEFIADQLVALQEKEAAENNALRYLESSLTDTQKALRNLLAAVEQGLPFTDTTKTRLSELEEQKLSLETEIAKERISRRILTKEQLVYWIGRFKGGDVNDEHYCENLIDTFVNSVFVYDDRIVITYNYTRDDNKVTISDLDKLPPPHHKRSRNPRRRSETRRRGFRLCRLT